MNESGFGALSGKEGKNPERRVTRELSTYLQKHKARTLMVFEFLSSSAP